MLKKLIIYSLLAGGIFLIYKKFIAKKKEGNASVQRFEPKKHTKKFNQSISEVINAYLSIKDAFVDADTLKIKHQTNQFIQTLDNIDTLELKNDTASVFETVISAINDLKLNAQSILMQNSVLEMRKDFSSLSDMMFPAFFYAVGYEGPTLYFQNCPMAIDDSIPANWISDQAEIVNPYLGNNHPVYKSSMLHCGEVKDSVVTK